MSAPDFFDDGSTLEVAAGRLHKIEAAGDGLVRLTFTLDSKATTGKLRRPVVHVIIPAASVTSAGKMLIQGHAMGYSDASRPMTQRWRIKNDQERDMQLSEEERQLIEVLREQKGDDELELLIVRTTAGAWEVTMGRTSPRKIRGVGRTFDEAWNGTAPVAL